MLNRSKPARDKAIKKMHDAWDHATQRERAVFISGLRAKSLVKLQSSCETLLRKEPPQQVRHNA